MSEQLQRLKPDLGNPLDGVSEVDVPTLVTLLEKILGWPVADAERLAASFVSAVDVAGEKFPLSSFIAWVSVPTEEADPVVKKHPVPCRETPSTDANPYLDALTSAGGEESIQRNCSVSSDIRESVKRAVKRYECAPSRRQDCIHQCMTFDDLTARAKHLHSRFNEVINDMVKFAKGKLPAITISARVGGIKGKERGMKKCVVDYGGDASQMADMLRATVVVNGTIDDLYKVAYTIISDEFFCKRNVHFVHFRDLYQKSSSNYRDMMTRLRLDGFLCELQFNLQSMIDVKESAAGHGLYEIIRLANDDLLIACIKNQIHAANDAVRRGADAKDLAESIHGLSCLHFAVYHGNLPLIDLVLRRGADPHAIDKEGYLPLHRAVLNRDADSAHILISHMDKDVLLRSFTDASGVRFMETAEFIAEMVSEFANGTILDFANAVVEKALDHTSQEVRLAASATISIFGHLSASLAEKCAEVVAEIEASRILKALVGRSLPATSILFSMRIKFTRCVDDIVADVGAKQADQFKQLVDHSTRLRRNVGQVLHSMPTSELNENVVTSVLSLLHEHEQTVLLLQAHLPDAASVARAWEDEFRFYALSSGSRCVRCSGVEILLGDDERVPTLTVSKVTRQMRRSIFLALARKTVCAIHGPPGTGKTETLQDTLGQLGFEPITICADRSVDRMKMCAQVCQMNQKVKRPVIIDEVGNLPPEVLSVIVENAKASDIRLCLTHGEVHTGCLDSLGSDFVDIIAQPPDWADITSLKMTGLKDPQDASARIVKCLELLASLCSKQPQYVFSMRIINRIVKGTMRSVQKRIAEEGDISEEQERICLTQTAFECLLPCSTAGDRQIVCETLLECMGVTMHHLRCWPITGHRWKDFVSQFLVVSSHHKCILVTPISEDEEEHCIANLQAAALEASADFEHLPQSLAQVSIDQLLGTFSADGGWMSGSLATCLRKMMHPTGRPLWVAVRIGSTQKLDNFESLNTLLDDNESLIIPSGECLTMNSAAGNRLIFIAQGGVYDHLNSAASSRLACAYSDAEAVSFNCATASNVRRDAKQ